MYMYMYMYIRPLRGKLLKCLDARVAGEFASLHVHVLLVNSDPRFHTSLENYSRGGSGEVPYIA